MQRLILQLREIASCDDLVADWWLFSDQDMINQGSACSIEEMHTYWEGQTRQSASEVEVIVLAPAHRVHMRELFVTRAQRRHLTKVLPYLMEPYLGQNPDEMHFVSTPVQNEKTWCFAASHQHMLAWQAWCAIFDARRLYLLAMPCVLALKPADGTSEVLGECFEFHQEQWCWLPKALPSRSVVSLLDIIGVNQMFCSSQTWQRMNLLRGHYQVASKGVSNTRPWALVAVLSILAFSTYSLHTYLATQSLNQQAQVIESQSNQAFLTLVPEEGRVVNLSRQLSARLQQVNTITEVPNTSAYEVLALLDEVRQALKDAQELRSVTWQPQGYRFEWHASSRITLERIQHYLVTKGVRAELEQTIKQDQGYLGVYRVSGVQP